jgi:hypothetical protein
MVCGDFGDLVDPNKHMMWVRFFMHHHAPDFLHAQQK